ncbi:MAG: endonuclease/exonuclease/phosphatase family protein [Bacteriovoracia bacterium]
MRTFFSFFALFFYLLTNNFAFAQYCERLLHRAADFETRALQEIDEIKILTYNVYNFDDSSDHRTKREGIKRTEDWQKKAIAESVRKADIAVFQEVLGDDTVPRFLKDYLDDEYTFLSIKGNDGRGIQIAFLIKKDLPFDIDLQTYRDETWVDPTSRKKTKTKLFSRDLPIIVVRPAQKESVAAGNMNRHPLFLLAGTHFKSKRPRSGDPESFIMRGAQVKRAAEIFGDLENQYPDTPMLLAGDFNGRIHLEDTFKPLWQGGMIDLLDVENGSEVEAKPINERYTYVFHESKGSAVLEQIDAIVSTDPRIGQTAMVLRPADRERKPSDHFPILSTLDFKKILAIHSGQAKPLRLEEKESYYAKAVRFINERRFREQMNHTLGNWSEPD